MKKFTIVVFIMTVALLSCEKDQEPPMQIDNSTTTNVSESDRKVGDVNVKVSSPFEPIRLARARTTPNHAGRICSCNECFGLCNAPHDSSAEGGMIGIEELPGSKANLYFLNKLPSNFESEFGIDESFYFKDKNGNVIHIIATGAYNALRAEGMAKDLDTGLKYRYFATVQVNLE